MVVTQLVIRKRSDDSLVDVREIPDHSEVAEHMMHMPADWHVEMHFVERPWEKLFDMRDADWGIFGGGY